MANNPPLCKLCSKGITQHAPTILFSTCRQHVHTTCLPIYLDVDIIYSKDKSNHWSCPSCLKELYPFYILESNSDILPHMHDLNPPRILNTDDMLFDPFYLDAEADLLDDLDPDVNFYNVQARNISSSCKFLPIEQLNKEISKLGIN